MTPDRARRSRRDQESPIPCPKTICRSRCGSAGRSGTGCSPTGGEPYPVAVAAYRTRWPSCASATPTCRPTPPTGDRSAVDRPGDVRPQHRQALLRHAARGRRHRAAGDAVAGPGRRGAAGPPGSAWSTSATSSRVAGEVITSRARRAVGARRRWEMAAKALRPLPVAHKPMSRGGAGPPAVRRPDHAPAGARHGPHPGRRWCAACATSFAPTRLHRGRDADAADCCTAARRPARS